MSKASRVIKFEEGFRAKPYYCSEGYPTIGWGRVVGKKGDKLPDILTDTVAEEVFLQERIHRIHEQIPDILEPLNDDRRAILISMAYQLGVAGLRKFKKFLQALSRHDWAEAEVQMMDSLWAKQTPNRADRHAAVIFSGSLKSVKQYESF